ncbi:MAG: AAA family ATPase [Zetaproteobacteria bacterium]|nr:AAA family ATPase [Zetaproteobacteria bacterium]
MNILKNIHIKSFKSILDQKIELGKINVFIGNNGAGKSNVLEAIGMLSAAISGQVNYQKLSERGMRLSTPEVFRSALKNQKRKASLFIEGTFDDFQYHAYINAEKDWTFHSEKFTRGSNLETRIAGRSNSMAAIQGADSFSKKDLDSSISIGRVTEVLGYFLESETKAMKALSNYAIYAPSTPILRGVVTDESHKSPLGLYGGSLATALSDVIATRSLDDLNRFFSLFDWFEQVRISKPDGMLQSNHVHTSASVVSFKDKFMQRNFKDLYAYDVSEGALYVLFVLLLLTHEDSPPIFALDNVDSALNPGLVTAMVSHISEILKNNPEKQIFMTTHNPTTLDAIDLFNPDHRLFVTKRDDNGATIFERISPPKGMTKEGWQEKYGYMKLSEIWLSGAIEGLTPPRGF